jgi:hypothetical protein
VRTKKSVGGQVAGGKVAKRLLPKNTEPLHPTVGIPTEGPKVDCFENYRKVLLLEAPQPIPIDKVHKIKAQCWRMNKTTKVCMEFFINGFFTNTQTEPHLLSHDLGHGPAEGTVQPCIVRRTTPTLNWQ